MLPDRAPFDPNKTRREAMDKMCESIGIPCHPPVLSVYIACGSWCIEENRATCDLGDVTCKSCKKSRLYRWAITRHGPHLDRCTVFRQIPCSCGHMMKMAFYEAREGDRGFWGLQIQSDHATKAIAKAAGDKHHGF